MEIVDYLTMKCREAGHTDKEFIEASRFGAKCLCDRMLSDEPMKEEQLFDSSSYCSIWRNTNERPKDNTQIVLRNAAMITYAFYKHGMCYYEGYSVSLTSFNGKWCYRADMWGVDRMKPNYMDI